MDIELASIEELKAHTGDFPNVTIIDATATPWLIRRFTDGLENDTIACVTAEFEEASQNVSLWAVDLLKDPIAYRKFPTFPVTVLANR